MKGDPKFPNKNPEGQHKVNSEEGQHKVCHCTADDAESILHLTAARQVFRDLRGTRHISFGRKGENNHLQHYQLYMFSDNATTYDSTQAGDIPTNFAANRQTFHI